jgi:hypothetical protein
MQSRAAKSSISISTPVSAFGWFLLNLQKDQCQHQETKGPFSGCKTIPGGALPHGEPFSADNFKTQELYDYSNRAFFAFVHCALSSKLDANFEKLRSSLKLRRASFLPLCQ